MKVTTVGVDLAKNVFAIHGVDGAGKVCLKKTLKRGKLLEFFAQLPPCLVGMEAGSGAHYWARKLEELGHTPRIMAPRWVAPYRKNEKNDGNDAEAVCEAVGRPNMRFVAVKTIEAQGLLTMHRVRAGWMGDRTAMANRMRGLLAEFGMVLPKGVQALKGAMAEMLEDAENGLPGLARRALADLWERFMELERTLARYDQWIGEIAQQDEVAQRLMSKSGVGAMTASATVATVGDAKQFRNGRQFAAWLGLVPRQYSTGGKPRLGRITKRGDRYLRMLFIQGARSVLANIGRHDDALARWAKALIARGGFNKAVVALAAKHARIVWAMMARQQCYRPELGARPAS